MRNILVLSQVLKHLYSLEWIDLTWCLLTAASMSLLADMIKVRERNYFSLFFNVIPFSTNQFTDKVQFGKTA